MANIDKYYLHDIVPTTEYFTVYNPEFNISGPLVILVSKL
jgi:hypothetical protein